MEQRVRAERSRNRTIVPWSFRKFLDTIDESVPPDLDIHLILDNYATHKMPLIRWWLSKRPRFHLHFTPTGASWINLVERWFATLTDKQIRRGVHCSTRTLETAIIEYLRSPTSSRDPSAGRRRPTRSSLAANAFVDGSQTHETRSAYFIASVSVARTGRHSVRGDWQRPPVDLSPSPANRPPVLHNRPLRCRSSSRYRSRSK